MNQSSSNPFEYQAAIDLPSEHILTYYIEEFNFSRVIESKRNVFLVGDRGSGKSMALLYNSWDIQRLKAARDVHSLSLSYLGVYIPCKTPLMHKQECLLISDDADLRRALSEHFLVLAIARAIAVTLGSVPEVLDGIDDTHIRSRIELLLHTSLPKDIPLFAAIENAVDDECEQTQRLLNHRASPEVRCENTFSFASLIIPLLRCARSLPCLRDSHYLLLLDDADDLNPYQFEALSTWIAARDQSMCSFKVGIEGFHRIALKTSTGGSILENHDFVRIETVPPLHSGTSAFGRLAKLLIARRLHSADIETSPEQFFPVSASVLQGLEEAEQNVRQEAMGRFPGDPDRVSSYVSKHKRARFFRDRGMHSASPEYSGLDTLIYLSTGVIRNLLVPCYWMYDHMLSLAHADGTGNIQAIAPAVQDQQIVEHSRRLWEWIERGLDQNIVGCSRDDATNCFQLLNNIAIHLHDRLHNHKSEPIADAFVVSDRTDPAMEKLERLLGILRSAALIYIRTGPGKEKGRRERYYVLNRLLLPDRGLDPHECHARLSFSSTILWAAASENRRVLLTDDDEEDDGQHRLFR